MSWMPKQKSHVQTALKKLIGFLEVFATSAQHFQHPMEKTSQWRPMSGWPMSIQPHLMDIIQVCMFC